MRPAENAEASHEGGRIDPCRNIAEGEAVQVEEDTAIVGAVLCSERGFEYERDVPVAADAHRWQCKGSTRAPHPLQNIYMNTEGTRFWQWRSVNIGQ